MKNLWTTQILESLDTDTMSCFKQLFCISKVPSLSLLMAHNLYLLIIFCGHILFMI